MTWTYQEMYDKAEWEGGYDQLVEWMEVDEAPEEIRELWRDYSEAMRQVRSLEYEITDFIDEKLGA